MTSECYIAESTIKNKRGENINHLILDGAIWMSNDDDELNDIERATEKAWGKCLVGGLGLGTILKELINKDDVEEIHVYEINYDVINTVAPIFNIKRYTDKIFVTEKTKIILSDVLRPHYIYPNIVYDYTYFDIYPEPTKEAYDQWQLFLSVFKDHYTVDCIHECWRKDLFEKGIFWK